MPTQDKMIDANTVTAAYREYDCHMPDGREIVVGVSSGRSQLFRCPLARELGAGPWAYHGAQEWTVASLDAYARRPEGGRRRG